MAKDISLRQKYREVKARGKIVRTKGNNYTFTAFPDNNCPVLKAEKYGQWQLVEEAYQLIKEYN